VLVAAVEVQLVFQVQDLLVARDPEVAKLQQVDHQEQLDQHLHQAHHNQVHHHQVEDHSLKVANKVARDKSLVENVRK
jgi:hypothetical protein